MVQEMAMYDHDWMDELQMGAIFVGLMVALAAQVALTLLVLRPLDMVTGLIPVGLVALCVVAGAFVASWKAQRGMLANGLVSALLCASVSLVITALHTPAELTLLNILIMFGFFAALGLCGGFIAKRMYFWRLSR
jgi:hypothetical protein